MLSEYTPQELEQNSINNMKKLNIDEMIKKGMNAEQIADQYQTAKFNGHKTLRYPKKAVATGYTVSS